MQAQDTRPGGRWIANERGYRDPDDVVQERPAEREVPESRHFQYWHFACGYSVPVFPLFERLKDANK